jgi:hypothetical protein
MDLILIFEFLVFYISIGTSGKKRDWEILFLFYEFFLCVTTAEREFLMYL